MPRTTAQTRRMLRLHDVVERTGLSRSTIYNMVGRGDFPQPRKLTGQLNGWPEREVTAWLEARPRAQIGGTGSEA